MLATVTVDLVQVLHTNRLILPMCKKPQKFLHSLFSHQCICCWNRKRVFILGPSHHVRLSGCALSSVAKYRTPFYDLTIDAQGKNSTLLQNLIVWLNLFLSSIQRTAKYRLFWVDELGNRWRWAQHWNAFALHCQSVWKVCLFFFQSNNLKLFSWTTFWFYVQP